METIAQKIKSARKKAGLTQKELGSRLGVSASMIALYETEKRDPKTETLHKIADALGVDIFELIPEQKVNTPWTRRTEAEKTELLEMTGGNLLTAQIIAAYIDMPDAYKKIFLGTAKALSADFKNAEPEEGEQSAVDPQENDKNRP